jgi:hypothetical protein
MPGSNFAVRQPHKTTADDSDPNRLHGYSKREFFERRKEQLKINSLGDAESEWHHPSLTSHPTR